MKAKRIGIALALALTLGTGSLFAQTIPNFSQIQTDFGQFADDIATTLPAASTIGLNWSSAYIGQLPHFGIGLATGFLMAPTTGLDALAGDFGMSSLSSALGGYSGMIGVPIPAAVLEARIGGLFLPFDVGIKVGFIPNQTNLGNFLPAGMNLNFHLYGIDIRYPLVKEGLLKPAVSVGLGFNHFDGYFSAPVGSTITVGSIYDPTISANQTLTMAAPDALFKWNSNAIDATIQVSKSILYILTPYVGFGATYGISQAGGGLSAKMQLNGVDMTQAQAQAIEQYYAAATGQTVSFDPSQGFTVLKNANGFSFRVYAGTSLNIWVLKLDVDGIYNLSTGKLGMNLGTRVQF